MDPGRLDRPVDRMPTMNRIAPPLQTALIKIVTPSG